MQGNRFLLIPLVASLTSGLTLATDLTLASTSTTDRQLPPLVVMSRNGQLNARDGDMQYTLKKDGSFCSFPLGMSGVFVQGKWKMENSSQALTVQVEGRWGGVNQVSPNDQFLTETVAVRPGTLHDTGDPKNDIYQCTDIIRDEKDEIHPAPVVTTPLPSARLTL